LEGRKIKIYVLDLENAAPTFASRALDALKTPGAPLNGLKITMEYVSYNWQETAFLEEYLKSLNLSQSAVVVMAEGGLFDYGKTEEIIANLEVLYYLTPLETVLAGTITPPQRAEEGFARIGGSRTIARTLEEFRDLSIKTGWTIVENSDRLINYVIRLHKSPDQQLTKK
jgi:hypothetical protein